MTITTSFPLVSGFDLTTSFQDIYTVIAPYSRISVTAAAFNNYSESNAKITVRITQNGTSDSFDEIVTNHEIRSGENYLIPALIGQAIAVGGTIEAKASVNSSLNANITATLIT